MLGEQIGEFTGKVTGTRVLPGDDYRYVKLEISFQQEGTLYGVPSTDMGTYTIFERVPGQEYGEGTGITISAEGEGAIWKGHGVGRMTEGMGSSIRFSIAYQARGDGKFGRLNEVLVIGEHESAADGSIRTSLWEWK